MSDKAERRKLFPMMLDLSGRRCVVVGAGEVGEAKIRGLLAAKARVSAVAPEATSQVQEWARQQTIEYRTRPYAPGDLEGAFLVVAAASSPEINHQVSGDARQLGVLCNVVDDPEHCDFFYPAVVRRGALLIAISTSGVSPAFARRVRQRLEAQFGEEYGAWLDEVARQRKDVLRGVGDPAERRRMLEELALRGSPLHDDPAK